MIYRCHTNFQASGALGTFLGYITLCHGHINTTRIVCSLQQAKLVPENWFVPAELSILPSNVNGGIAYMVDRRSPRTHLFYLCPMFVGNARNTKAKEPSWMEHSFIIQPLTTSFAYDMGVASPRTTPRPTAPVAAPAPINLDDDFGASLEHLRRMTLPRRGQAGQAAQAAPQRRVRPTRNSALEGQRNPVEILDGDEPADDDIQF